MNTEIGEMAIEDVVKHPNFVSLLNCGNSGYDKERYAAYWEITFKCNIRNGEWFLFDKIHPSEFCKYFKLKNNEHQ